MRDSLMGRRACERVWGQSPRRGVGMGDTAAIVSGLKTDVDLGHL